MNITHNEIEGHPMGTQTTGTGADMKQAAGTYGAFLVLLKVLIGVSLVGLMALTIVYNV